VVDDDLTVTRSCQRILTDADYDVVTTHTACDGLSLALSEHFDLVVTDLKMPGMGGVEFVRKLNALCPEIPTIVITGYGSVVSAVESATAGVSAYIEKPFTPEQLIAAVGQAMSQRAKLPRRKPSVDLVRGILTVAGANRKLSAAKTFSLAKGSFLGDKAHSKSMS